MDTFQYTVFINPCQNKSTKLCNHEENSKIQLFVKGIILAIKLRSISLTTPKTN